MKKTGLKIIVSGLLLAYIFYTIDLNSLANNFRQLNAIYIPLIFILITLNYVVSSFRWKYLIDGRTDKDVTLLQLIRLYFEGSFFNNFMPTSIGGDVYKVYALNKKIEDLNLAFVSTFMERFTGVIALLILSIIGITQLIGVLGILLLIAFVICVYLGVIILDKLAVKVKKLQKLNESIQTYKSEKKILGVALITSFVVQMFPILTQYIIFVALGFPVSFIYALIFFPVITLATFLIPSLNGFGVQDALYMQLFQNVGVPVEIALTASIIYHLCRMLISLVGGVSYAISK